MINFRYHLASLIAVFLALGLGVVVGSAFVSPATVKVLKTSLDNLDNRDKALEAQNNALALTNKSFLQGAVAARPWIVHDKLAGRTALVVSFDSTPGAETTQVAATLVEAGARLQGSIVLSSNLGLADDASRQQVATALGTQSASAEALQSTLVHQLSEALSGHTPGLLQRLVDAGLARSAGVSGGAEQPTASLAAPGSMVVILAPVAAQGGPKPPGDLGRTLILPLVRSLSSTTALVAVGEDGSDPLPVLGALRQDSSLHVVTVDGADTPWGQAAFALGLSQAASAGAWGSYGFGSGATSSLPSPAPTTSSPVTPTATFRAR